MRVISSSRFRASANQFRVRWDVGRAFAGISVRLRETDFFATHKRWWMLPMIVVVLLLGVLIIAAQSSALAPFIYSLF